MDFLNVVIDFGLPFLFVLTVLVFVHEMGHYLIARYYGVRVEVFWKIITRVSPCM